MDINWIEYLLPIIFFILYGISKIFGKGGNQEIDESSPPSVDLDEQQRKIQEEIRRRIDERRKSAEPVQSDSTLKPQELTIERTSVPEGSPFRTPKPVSKDPQVPSQLEDIPDLVDIGIQQQLATQMEQLRKVNRQSDPLIKSIPLSAKKNEYVKIKKRGKKNKFRIDITSILKDRQGAKKAFLYSEILGPPMGQRRQSVFAPLVDQ